ncbi:hypothetical protein L2E82_34759 [Cichorium intybus]|uniref:Uncharacterized protein n=1 Tax=Cichorium intybus TaxID=13427 RepID=A0ACB9BMR4_CICIN|nr:hypothetical protein L2E82_34759 [Cichorium intybus]
MIATMKPELQRIYEDYWPYESTKTLRKSSASKRVSKGAKWSKPSQMASLRTESLSALMCKGCKVTLIGLESWFTLAYHLNNTQTSLAELHGMLQTAENGLKGKSVPSVSQPVLAIGHGKGKKRKGPPKQNWREKVQVGSSSNGPRAKSSSIPHVTNPKDADCFYCKEKGH